MRICIPLRPKSFIHALKLLDHAQKKADIVELWIDTLSDKEVAVLIAKAKRPVLVVCKGKREKGDFKGSELQRVEKLIAAVMAGARYVDVGLHTADALIKKIKKVCEKRGAELVISHHDWKRTPSLDVLLKIAQQSGKKGADIIKIAAYCTAWSDTVVLYELVKRLREKKYNVVVVGMGQKSFFARLGCAVLGGEWTYAALDKKSATASGQPTVEEMRDVQG
ncbi:type I 3-dehydroquinate dehydratase [Candidatus Gracilibacteria bacterium]|nr:type I 3-dehydroquinate dehydratase [Candidatus Gracilibacteria bacterium]